MTPPQSYILYRGNRKCFFDNNNKFVCNKKKHSGHHIVIDSVDNDHFCIKKHSDDYWIQLDENSSLLGITEKRIDCTKFLKSKFYDRIDDVFLETSDNKKCVLEKNDERIKCITNEEDPDIDHSNWKLLGSAALPPSSVVPFKLSIHSSYYNEVCTYVDKDDETIISCYPKNDIEENVYENMNVKYLGDNKFQIRNHWNNKCLTKKLIPNKTYPLYYAKFTNELNDCETFKIDDNDNLKPFHGNERNIVTSGKWIGYLASKNFDSNNAGLKLKKVDI